MKKLLLLFTVPIAISALFFLYNSYVPIAYTNECKDKSLFRYQFGIYKIDTIDKKEVSLKQIGNAEDYFGFDKPACIDGIYKYEQSLRKKETDSINKTSNWKLVKHNLYRNKNGDIGFQENRSLGEGAITVIDYITKLGFNDGKPLKNAIDTATFEDLGCSYYKDKKHIYIYYAMLGGGSFSIDTKVDYKTFKVIGDTYAKDKNHIYADRMGIMEDVDYKTFHTKIGIGAYAKDKNGYYYWGQKIDTANYDDEYTKEAIKKLNNL